MSGAPRSQILISYGIISSEYDYYKDFWPDYVAFIELK